MLTSELSHGVFELANAKNSNEVGNSTELLTVQAEVKTANEAGDLDAQNDAETRC